MTALSLYSGIGGMDLAAEWAGFKTVAYCERDEYCRRVLRKNFGSDILIFENTKDVTGAALKENGINGVTLLHGGFPCQPFSGAGNQLGAEDDRDDRQEMLRIISEVRPDWVIGENVANLVTFFEFEEYCISLESSGYEVQPFIIPASSVGAPHKRDRIFVVANSANNSSIINVPIPANTDTGSAGLQRSERRESLQEGKEIAHGAASERYRNPAWQEDWVSAASRLCRMDDGLFGRMEQIGAVPPPAKGQKKKEAGHEHRLTALGNACSPYQVFPIMYCIASVIRNELYL